LSLGITGFLFDAPPGFGKTVCLIWLASYLKRATLIIVPRSNLVDQWYARLAQHTNLTEDEIGIATISRQRNLDAPIVIGLVHSLALDRFGSDFKKRFGAVMFDEVDRSTPPQTFAPVACMFPAKIRIGASAVMSRQDKLDTVFKEHVGQVVVHGSREDRLKPRVLVVYYTPSSGTLGEWADSFSKNQRRGVILSRIAGNQARSQMIANYVVRMVESGRRVAILSDRKEQLYDIMTLIHSVDLNIEIGWYVRTYPYYVAGKKKPSYRQLKTADREDAAKYADVLLCTYRMFAIGTDIPDMSGLVFATPQLEIEQAKGRIERVYEGKKHPVIVDIVDPFYPEALRWSRGRNARYKKQGLEVKTVWRN
jgi:superfamily II DNA or RNA helicase